MTKRFTASLVVLVGISLACVCWLEFRPQRILDEQERGKLATKILERCRTSEPSKEDVLTLISYGIPAIAPIEQVLGDRAYPRKRFAIGELSGMKSQASQESLIRLLSSPLLETRKLASEFLYESAEPLPSSTRVQALRLLGSAELDDRRNALLLLSKCQVVLADRPAVMKALEDPDEYVQGYALATLRRYGVGPSDALRAAGHRSGLEHVSAAALMVADPDDPAGKAVRAQDLKLLSDPSSDSAYPALGELIHVPGGDVTRAIDGCLNSNDDRIVNLALKAIRIRRTSLAIDNLGRLACGPGWYPSAYSALVAIGSSEARTTLRSLAAGGSPDAVRALGNLGDRADRQFLLGLLTNSSKKIRFAAAAALSHFNVVDGTYGKLPSEAKSMSSGSTEDQLELGLRLKDNHSDWAQELLRRLAGSPDEDVRLTTVSQIVIKSD